MAVEVVKASGEREAFSGKKLEASLVRAGVNPNLAKRVVRKVGAGLYDGIPTDEVLAKVLDLLKEARRPSLAAKYDLKRAVMRLGPSGYPFERFVAGILVHEGFQVSLGEVVRGQCIAHEIDVIAERVGKRFMVECKFHNRSGIKSDSKIALYVHARFLDVRGSGFDQGWLVTNTKVTSDAEAYAKCVGLKVISWNSPRKFSLRFLVEKNGLYPITCLASLRRREKEMFLREGVVFCRDLCGDVLKALPPARRGAISKEVRGVLRAV